MSERDDHNDDLPAGLRQELRGLYTPQVAMGAGRDEDILAAARAVYGNNKVPRWPWMAGAGLAAAVAITAGLWWISRGTSSVPPVAAYARTGDIRDAFYLERQLDHGSSALEATWDVNHDGRVDEADVRLLALAAVKIGKEPTP